jgi:hypothetical protein
MMGPLDPNESNSTRLWAEIWKLRNEAQGPSGFETWRDAAIEEKIRRVAAEHELNELKRKLRTLVEAT